MAMKQYKVIVANSPPGRKQFTVVRTSAAEDDTRTQTFSQKNTLYDV